MAASDIFRLIGFLFVFGIMLVIGLHILREFNANDPVDSTTGQTIIDNTSLAFTSADYSIIVFIVGAILILVISAFTIQTHPLFFIVSLLVFIFVIYITAQITNVYESYIEPTDINATATQLPLLNRAMSNLPFVALIMGAIFFIALYAKGGF